MLPCRAPVTAGSLALLLLVLALAATAGAALLASVLGPREDADAIAALALPAGLLAFALPGWVASTLFPVPFRTVVVPLGLLAWAACVVLGRRSLGQLLGAGRALLVPVAVPLAGFLLFLWLRYPDGAVQGTEKPMDLAVLSAVLEGAKLPLGDPWLAGERFSYYHFGTLLLGLPFRLAGIAPAFAYNLIAALLAGLAAASAFGAARLRGGGRRLALLAAAALLLAGTFEGARQLLAGTPVGSVDFWASSRRVAHAITEWPLFTLRLGDLHPHAVALPLLLAWAGLCGRTRSAVAEGALLGGLLAANPWDLPAACLILGCGVLLADGPREGVRHAAGAVLASVPLLLPFLSGPRPPFLGLALSPAATTSPEAFLHLGGFVAVPALALGIALVRSREAPETALLVANAPPAVAIVLSTVTGRPVLGLAAGFLVGLAFLGRRPRGAVRAGFLLAGAGAALAAVPEVLVVLDPYGETLRRMNTLFKTWAGAAPLFVLASSLLLPLVLAARRARKTVRVLLAGVLAGLLVHPAAALAVRLSAGPGTLDGLARLASQQPGDVAAIAWLLENAPPGAVLAEAPGTAYTLHGRISAASGRPCVLGWSSHEVVWRGDAVHPELERRRSDLLTVYTSRDTAAVKRVLAARGVSYVVVGRVELEMYGLDAFPARAAFELVLRGPGIALYRVPAP